MGGMAAHIIIGSRGSSVNWLKTAVLFSRPACPVENILNYQSGLRILTVWLLNLTQTPILLAIASDVLLQSSSLRPYQKVCRLAGVFLSEVFPVIWRLLKLLNFTNSLLILRRSDVIARNSFQSLQIMIR